MKNAFFHLKSSSRPDFFGHVGKQLGKKVKGDFKNYDVTN